MREVGAMGNASARVREPERAGFDPNAHDADRVWLVNADAIRGRHNPPIALTVGKQLIELGLGTSRRRTGHATSSSSDSCRPCPARWRCLAGFRLPLASNDADAWRDVLVH